MDSQPRTDIKLRNLVVTTASGVHLVDDVDLTVRRGRVLGLVGESGGGKSTVGRAFLGYVSPGLTLSAGTLQFDGQELDLTESSQANRLRGRTVSYMPQNPGSSLNPSMHIGTAIEAMVRRHREGDLTRYPATAALRRVELPDSPEFRRRYRHQLSGGQQQRVSLAVAIAAEPELVVMDEPTTGLDVITQQSIVAEVRRLQSDSGMSILYATHDLTLLAQIADDIAVMYAGRIVEVGSARDVLRNPQHPYTRGLLDSIPDHRKPYAIRSMPGTLPLVEERPGGCKFAPRCHLSTDECTRGEPELREVATVQVRCIKAPLSPAPTESPAASSVSSEFKTSSVTPVLRVEGVSATYPERGSDRFVVRGASLELRAGAVACLVGGSGSGKTTLARTILGLHAPAEGQIILNGQALAPQVRARSRAQRQQIQVVFQNPLESVNPRRTIREIVGRAGHVLRGLRGEELDRQVRECLDQVRLTSAFLDRLPREVSGGELQRVGIARALIADPSVVVCDEVTSALDVSVQAAILQLLQSLSRDKGIALLFITHDLGVVSTIADEVMVMHDGVIAERGTADAVLRNPSDPYTKRLISASPGITQALASLG